MQTLTPPHMALNSADFTERYQMWNTWNDIGKEVTREFIIAWVRVVAVMAPGKKLKNLVINSHGHPAHLSIGQGFGATDVALFAGWAGFVETIWLNACSIADVTADGNGLAFMYSMATYADATIYASTNTQYTTGGKQYPYGQIDRFEGALLQFTPRVCTDWIQKNDPAYEGD